MRVDTARINDEKYDLFLNTNCQLYMQLNKRKTNCYTIFDNNNKTFIEDLDTFGTFTYFRDYFPLQILKSLLYVKEQSKTDFDKEIAYINSLGNLKSSEASMIILDNTEMYYKIYRDYINYKAIIVDMVDFVATDKRFIQRDGHKILNHYVLNTKYKSLDPDINAKFPHIEFIIRNICGSDNRYNYFIKFLAYKLQNLSDVPPCHFIVQDEGGTGKSDLLFGDILNNLFNVNIIGQEELESPFNFYMANCELVVCEEVEGYKDEKKLKKITGSKYITLNQKNKPQIKIKNNANLIIFSNDLRVMKISHNDRRWNVLGGGKRLSALSDNDWSKTAFKNLEENKKFFKGYHKNLKDELKSFYSYLTAVEVDRLDIQINMMNELKENIIDLNKNSESVFIDEIEEEGIFTFIKENVSNNYQGYINKIIITRDEGIFIKVSDFYNLYTIFCQVNKFKMQLSKRMFGVKISDNENYFNIFDDKILLKIDGIPHRVLKFNEEFIESRK